MMSPTPLTLSAPPQTGRLAATEAVEEAQRGLWGQLLAAFRDLSGAFDPFANDADPQVRELGRLARQRPLPNPSDYFAIGDLCARLTPRGTALSETYAAKTIAAYLRASELDPNEQRATRNALLAFADWVSDAALKLDGYEALKVGLLVCERVQQVSGLVGTTAESERLHQAEAELRERLTRIFEDEQGEAKNDLIVAERESRLLCDQGQMLLRQNQATEALGCFERAIQADERNHAAWLWRAMALTDLGRFDDALGSYDRALALEPSSAGVWNSKGALLLELGRMQLALECFEQALNISAAVSTVKAVYWLNKGKALYMLARYPEALVALQESHNLDPSPESAAGIAACNERLEATASA